MVTQDNFTLQGLVCMGLRVKREISWAEEKALVLLFAREAECFLVHLVSDTKLPLGHQQIELRP